MPTLTLNIYSVTNGEYNTDRNGNRTIMDTLSVPFSYGGARSISGRRFQGVKSFDVVKTSNTSWRASINKSNLLGIYESAETAAGSVVGAFIASGANSLTGIEDVMEHQLSMGGSTIEYSQPTGPLFSMDPITSTFVLGTLITGTGTAWLNSTFGVSAGTLTAQQDVITLAPTGVSASVANDIAAKDWTWTVDGQVFNIPAREIDSNGSTLNIINNDLCSYVLDAARTDPYIIENAEITTESPTFEDVQNWFHPEPGSTFGWHYPQMVGFNSSGQVKSWCVFGPDNVEATDATFLAAYAAANSLPSGQQADGSAVKANGWNNTPRYPDMDYDALVTYIVDQMGDSSYDDWNGVRVNIDLEYGFQGYDIVNSTTVREGPARAPGYYDVDDTSNAKNIDVAQWNLSQTLNGQFIKLAELVRQQAITDGSTGAPLINFYNAPDVPDRIHITNGEIDGRDRTYSSTSNPSIDIRANTAWEDVPTSLKQEFCRRVAVQNYKLYQGGVVDGVTYPALDSISLLSFAFKQTDDPADNNIADDQINSSIYLADAFKNLADSGTTVPPREVMGQLTVNSKGSSTNSGDWLSDATISAYAGSFVGKDVSSYQWLIFNYEKYWSAMFPLDKTWSQMSATQQGWANTLFSEMVTPWTAAGYTFPDALSTAQLTIEQTGFRTTARRRLWWNVWAKYIIDKYAADCIASCI